MDESENNKKEPIKSNHVPSPFTIDDLFPSDSCPDNQCPVHGNNAFNRAPILLPPHIFTDILSINKAKATIILSFRDENLLADGKVVHDVGISSFGIPPQQQKLINLLEATLNLLKQNGAKPTQN